MFCLQNQVASSRLAEVCDSLGQKEPKLKFSQLFPIIYLQFTVHPHALRALRKYIKIQIWLLLQIIPFGSQEFLQVICSHLREFWNNAPENWEGNHQCIKKLNNSTCTWIFLLRSRPSCARCCANPSWGFISCTKFINTATNLWNLLINWPWVGKQTPAVCLLHKKLQLEGKEFHPQERFQPHRRASEGFQITRAGNSSFPGAGVTCHGPRGAMQGEIAPCDNSVTSWAAELSPELLLCLSHPWAPVPVQAELLWQFQLHTRATSSIDIQQCPRSSKAGEGWKISKLLVVFNFFYYLFVYFLLQFSPVRRGSASWENIPCLSQVSLYPEGRFWAFLSAQMMPPSSLIVPDAPSLGISSSGRISMDPNSPIKYFSLNSGSALQIPAGINTQTAVGLPFCAGGSCLLQNSGKWDKN